MSLLYDVVLLTSVGLTRSPWQQVRSRKRDQGQGSPRTPQAS